MNPLNPRVIAKSWVPRAWPARDDLVHRRRAMIAATRLADHLTDVEAAELTQALTSLPTGALWVIGFVVDLAREVDALGHLETLHTEWVELYGDPLVAAERAWLDLACQIDRATDGAPLADTRTAEWTVRRTLMALGAPMGRGRIPETRAASAQRLERLDPVKHRVGQGDAARTAERAAALAQVAADVRHKRPFGSPVTYRRGERR